MKQDWIGLRECARRVGRHHHALQKAIQEGRVPASAVRRDERGRVVAVDYLAAAVAWRANSDASQAERTAPPLRVPDTPGEPTPAAPASVQASGRAAIDDARDMAAVYPALEFAVLTLPAALAEAGLAAVPISLVLDRVFDAMRGELVARGNSLECANLLRGMLEDECRAPGTWTS